MPNIFRIDKLSDWAWAWAWTWAWVNQNVSQIRNSNFLIVNIKKKNLTPDLFELAPSKDQSAVPVWIENYKKSMAS